MRKIRRHHHRLKQAGIRLIVRGRHRALIGMHFGEDPGILVDGTILDEPPAGFHNRFLFLKPFGQEIDLQMKTPTLKVRIKLFQIGVMIDLLH
ncbi:hypothetical protein D1872_265020 [compost metagenome]